MTVHQEGVSMTDTSLCSRHAKKEHKELWRLINKAVISEFPLFFVGRGQAGLAKGMASVILTVRQGSPVCKGWKPSSEHVRWECLGSCTPGKRWITNPRKAQAGTALGLSYPQTMASMLPASSRGLSSLSSAYRLCSLSQLQMRATNGSLQELS